MQGDIHLYKIQGPALRINTCNVCHNLEALGKDRGVGIVGPWGKDVSQLLDAAMKKATEPKHSPKSRSPASRGVSVTAGARMSVSQGLRGTRAGLLCFHTEL